MTSITTQSLALDDHIVEFCSGDLVLLVGHIFGLHWRFAVSRDTLSKASPILNDLVKTTYTGGEVTLKDDDPCMWLIVLNILYDRPAEIPNEMSGDTLVSLATFCDRYDIAPICREHIDGWLIQTEQSEVLVNTLDRLYVYLVFGYPIKAKQMMALAINSVERDKEGRWITLGSGKPVEDRPPGLLGISKSTTSYASSNTNHTYQPI